MARCSLLFAVVGTPAVDAAAAGTGCELSVAAGDAQPSSMMTVFSIAAVAFLIEWQACDVVARVR